MWASVGLSSCTVIMVRIARHVLIGDQGYVAPGYSYGYYYHGPRHRYWDARFGCWRYR